MRAMGYTRSNFFPRLHKKTLAHNMGNNIDFPIDVFADLLLTTSADPEALVQEWTDWASQEVANFLTCTTQVTKVEEKIGKDCKGLIHVITLSYFFCNKSVK